MIWPDGKEQGRKSKQASRHIGHKGPSSKHSLSHVSLMHGMLQDSPQLCQTLVFYDSLLQPQPYVRQS